MGWSNYCRECGRTKEEHCVFDPLPVPEGCQCDPGDWSAGIVDICDGYVEDIRTGLCAKCEHLEECHPIRRALAKDGGKP